ncbi:hypothetical protein PLESTM_001179400 [Pleodorina starrii]|nr:hypothetical protein PLESTM_001179400 [Pleodorina starrii]
MVIPAGLTRTLASQNTSLDMDDEDDDDEDEDDKHSVIVDDHEHDPDHDGDVVVPDSGSTAAKQKRRATLSLDKDGGGVMRSGASVLMRGGRALTSGGGDDGGGGGLRSKSSGLESLRSGGSVSRQRRSSELAALPTSRTSEDGAAAADDVSGMDWLLRHARSLRVAVLQWTPFRFCSWLRRVSPSAALPPGPYAHFGVAEHLPGHGHDHEHDPDHDGDVVVPDSGSTAAKQKRRATLSLDKDGGGVMRSGASVLMRGGRALTSGGGDDGGGGGLRSKSSGLESLRSGGSVSRQRRSSELAALPTSRTSEDGAAAADDVSGMDWLLRHARSLRVAVLQRIRSVVSLTPFHSHATEFGNNWGTASKRKLKYDSHETVMVITPFAMWSVLVIVLYTVAVTRMKGIVEVVAVHSVSNFLAARTFRAELAVLDDPSLLPSYRAAVGNVEKVVRDAWYTLLLGANAYRATGPDTERFPLVKSGLAYASPHLSHIVYGSGRCHRAGGNCPGPEFRYFKITHSTLDGMMLEYLMNLKALASNTSSVLPGLSSPEFDYIYNIGSKDLLDGAAEIQDAHLTIIRGLFDETSGCGAA